MPWFYVDDAFADSKPVMKLDRALRNEAIGLWVRCGAWSAKEETDGHVPLDTVRHFGGTPRLIRALHDQAELWVESSPDSWRDSREILFGNWEKWQKTHAELLEKRREAAERQRRSRAKKAKGRNALTGSDESMSQRDDEQSATGDDDDRHESVTRDPHARARRPDPTRPLVITSGGECAVGSDDGLPPRYCPDHPNGTNRGCGPCRDARKRREAAEAQQAQDELDARRRHRERQANCQRCQGHNTYEDDLGRVYKCNHEEG